MKKEHIILFQQLTWHHFYLVLSAVSLQILLLKISSCYVMFTTQYMDRDFTYFCSKFCSKINLFDCATNLCECATCSLLVLAFGSSGTAFWESGVDRLMITGDVCSSTKEEIAISELKKDVKMIRTGIKYKHNTYSTHAWGCHTWVQHALAAGTGWLSVDWTLLSVPGSLLHYMSEMLAAVKWTATRRMLLLAKGSNTVVITEMGKLTQKS